MGSLAMREIAPLGPSPNVFRGMIKLHAPVTHTVHRFLSGNTYSSRVGILSNRLMQKEETWAWFTGA